MIFDIILLILIYYLHKYIVSWIRYYNSTDKRYGNSIWRWTYDYPVEGKRDISDLDDKDFVRKEELGIEQFLLCIGISSLVLL